MDYKKTLLMPKTTFEMRGNLVQKDKLFISKEQKLNLYLNNKHLNKEFILHDGPPYANGPLHIGHALNKVLKDIIVRNKRINNYKVDWIFGWDTHGLPIENAVSKQEDWNPNLESSEKLRKFRNYALKQQQNQLKQFKKLGLFTDFDSKYLTLTPDYVSKEIEVLFKMLNDGLIFRSLKPIYWSWSSKTALAEAEIEYKDVISPSIYVEFKIEEDLSALIWTTTPWTLFANVGIAFGKDVSYGIYELNNKKLVIADNLVSSLEEKLKTKAKLISKFDVSSYIGKTALNLLTNKESKILYGHHVSDESGSGIVHIAGGHGIDDYKIVIENKLDLFVVTSEEGLMINTNSKLDGLFYKDAELKIIDILKNKNALILQENIKHSYPHDWRTKKPIIFVATLQWFVSIDKIKKDLLKNISNVNWYPSWGKDRLSKMISEREDWCISRQRSWGVPITIILDENDRPIIDLNLQKIIVEQIKQKGQSWWYQTPTEDILKMAGLDYKPSYKKETDILDVWFDSGISHYYMFENKQIDMYLEGSDQFRGWFNSSLITSQITKKSAPYKEVVVHGFVTDGDGKKMSKSIGNVIDPIEILNKFGIDILRLWVAKSDYSQSVKISDDILEQIVKDYKKIRNTLRFIMGNINNDLSNNLNDYKLNIIDEIILTNLNNLNFKLKESFKNYSFVNVITNILNSITNGPIAYYLDYSKDVLYTYGKDTNERKSIQFVLKNILDFLSFNLYSIIPVTIDEAINSFDEKINTTLDYKFDFELLKHFSKNKESNDLFILRDIVNLEIEKLRQQKIISSSLEVSLKLSLPKTFSIQNKDILAKALMVAQIEINIDSEIKVEAFKDNSLIKCLRCWKYFKKDQIFEDICKNCSKTVNDIE